MSYHRYVLIFLQFSGLVFVGLFRWVGLMANQTLMVIKYQILTHTHTHTNTHIYIYIYIYIYILLEINIPSIKFCNIKPNYKI